MLFRARLLAVLGAIASSVGVVGFVAVVGGMIVWIRFDSLHLPADTIVASIPRTSLIVIGLSTLIPFILLGLLAVILAYLFAADNLVPSRPWRDVRTVWGSQNPPASSGPPSTVLPTVGAAAEQPDQDSSEMALASLVQQAGELAADAASAADFGRVKVVVQRHQQLKALQRELDRITDWIGVLRRMADPRADTLRDQAAVGKVALEQADEQIDEALAIAARRSRSSLITWILTVLVLALIELGIVFLVGAPSYLQDFLLFVLGTLLALITLFIGIRTRGFAIFGVSIFSTILLFGTATTLLRTYHVPKVQPIAVLRAGHDAGLTGFFVAETSERVYLVRVSAKPRGSQFETSFPRLVVVPRSNVVAMEVGPLEDRQEAYGTSYKELRELCGQRVAEVSPKAAPKVSCGKQPGLVTQRSSAGSTKRRHRSAGHKRQTTRKSRSTSASHVDPQLRRTLLREHPPDP